MKTALLRRLERLETEQGLREGDRRLKIEFAYLKQLPREYTGPRHIVTVGRRPDGREECEERPGEPTPNHEAARDQNVMRIYIVHAAEPNTEIRGGEPGERAGDWMRTGLLKRLKRLEVVRAVETQAPVEFQMGYVKKLPEEYNGERHVVTVGRARDGKYRWEERCGATPAKSIIRLFLVRAKDGRPDYSWPEDAHPV